MINSSLLISHKVLCGPAFNAPQKLPSCNDKPPSPTGHSAIGVCHPRFSSPDTDIALVSLEGMLFRVRSQTLSTTSALFKTMFSLPQPKSITDEETGGFDNDTQTNSIPTQIIIHESSENLALILPLLTGLPPPKPLHTLSLRSLTNLLLLAEKWDTPGPISYIRNAINGSAGFFNTDPVRMYALARHFGWKEETARAAVGTLSLPIENLEKQWKDVQEGRKDWELLLNLRNRRYELFKVLIESRDRFTAGNNYICVQCGVTKLTTTPWDILKSTMLREMNNRPLGATLLACTQLDGEFAQWPESETCFRARCPKKECGASYYDKSATLKQIKRCVESLPWDIWEGQECEQTDN
ncbi:hypothetical protein AMATHDRAFT_149894 [Amanita thiersii Skay4041]|uniref:BTB domain-containing protein n=1 Tax=Amanita thiersii Skay4041 TaxID=703135 RepID=A0A2A9NL55_9AGAR|nr:hypothetical protein AMATHDRAFT_149894 [Amanita thiersii Skay4041]